jgi:hypothetical protein
VREPMLGSIDHGVPAGALCPRLPRARSDAAAEAMLRAKLL